MGEKVTGYSLLVIGILTILLSVFSVYMVFTKKQKPVDLFTLPGISIDLSNLAGSDLPPEAESQLKSPEALKTDLVQPDIINAPLNLFAHLIFMGFVANIGFKISSLGVQMLRPIKVNLKSEKGGEGNAGN